MLVAVAFYASRILCLWAKTKVSCCQVRSGDRDVDANHVNGQSVDSSRIRTNQPIACIAVLVHVMQRPWSYVQYNTSGVKGSRSCVVNKSKAAKYVSGSLVGFISNAEALELF